MSKHKFVTILAIFIGAVIAIPLFSVAFVGNTSQATLSVSPSTGSYNPNDTFQVSIYVNTNNQNVVGVSAYLTYDKTHFEATSIDTTGSVFTIEWEKIIDSANGKIKISRTIPTPGVNTANGLVAKVNFKALSNVSPSSDNLTFDFAAGTNTKSQVILDDGIGTNILTGAYGGKYTVGQGGPVTYGEGTLLKVVGGTKVYVLSDGKKCWIPTAEIFNSNGYKWSDVIEVAQSVMDSFLSGPDVTIIGGAIPEGGLILVKGDIDVYIVKYIGAKKFKRLILSPTVFNSYQHLKWSDIQDVDASVVNSFVTSDLVRAVNDSKVYKLTLAGDTGQKQWIKTAEVFTKMGFDWDSVYEINQVDRDSYVEGASLE